MSAAFFRTAAAAAILLMSRGHADVRSCACDPARPETMEDRECSLCRVAEEQPASAEYFTIRDSNPRKPNRWLVLPRSHGKSKPHHLGAMTPAERTAYWTAAIAKGRELWGEQWGLAVNSLEQRTQCHMHLHLGKLREGVENDRYVVVDGPADLPLPREGDGMWVHPVDGKLHAHWGDDIAELVLER